MELIRDLLSIVVLITLTEYLAVLIILMNLVLLILSFDRKLILLTITLLEIPNGYL